MKILWLFLVPLLIVVVLNLIYLPSELKLSVIGVFVVLVIALFVINLRLARAGLQVELEREQIKTIIGNLYDGIIAYDPNFKVLIFNRAAENIFNIKREHVIGSTFTPDKIHEPGMGLFVQILFPALAPAVTRLTPAGEYPQIARISFEDEQLDLKVVTSKITDSRGLSLGFFKAIHDETRERALLKSKTDFITVAAHQLRTPLAAINWIFEGFNNDSFGVLTDEQKEAAKTGGAATKKLSKTVNDLLDVSKIEEGKFGYKFEDTEVVPFIQEILEGYMAIASEYNVKIYFDNKLPEDIKALRIDPLKVSLVLQNLLDNAIKYNVKNGEVTIRIEKLPDKSFAQFSVKDTGVGVPEEDIEKLFTKFFRAQNVVRFETDGSGLGLYIARNVIRRHGGKIWATSELNRGSTFFFTIPTDPELIPKRESSIEEFI